MAKKRFNETDTFKKLQAKWYKKLEGSGFNDLEKTESDTMIRPEIISTKTVKHDQYHDLCVAILQNYRFKKELHREVFQLHANDLSERAICDELDRRGITLSRRGINYIITSTKENYLKGAK